jgi:hypothetical protein
MGAQPVVKINTEASPTPATESAAEATPTVTEKKAIGESAYPDEGF